MGLFTKRESVSFRDKTGMPLEEIIFSKELHGEYVPVSRDPAELKMKSVAQLEREHRKKQLSKKPSLPKQKQSGQQPSLLREIVSGLSGRTPAELHAAHKKQIAKMRTANLPLKHQVELQKVQREKERLMHQLGYVMTPWGWMPGSPQPQKRTTRKTTKKKQKKKRRQNK